MTLYIIPIASILLLTACSGGNGGGKYDDYREEPEEQTIESPYADGSGHDAGFKWAEDHDITDPADCGGNSISFIEGCEEYANTAAAYPTDATEEESTGNEMPYEDGR